MLVRTAMVGAVFRLANSQAARPAHREEYASSVSLRAISEYRKCTLPERLSVPIRRGTAARGVAVAAKDARCGQAIRAVILKSLRN